GMTDSFPNSGLGTPFLETLFRDGSPIAKQSFENVRSQTGVWERGILQATKVMHAFVSGRVPSFPDSCLGTPFLETLFRDGSPIAKQSFENVRSQTGVWERGRIV